MPRNKPSSDPRTATSTTSTTTTATPETEPGTDRVQTRTSGRIHHTDPVDGLRILAGSDIHSPNGTLIQFSTIGDLDVLTYDTAVTIENINPYHTNNVIISGTQQLATKNSKEDTVKLTKRVTFQTPYEARNIFQTLNNESTAAEFVDGIFTRWTVKESHIDYAITELLKNGFNVNIDHNTLQSLYGPHPEHTISDGEFIAINEALTDPDYYDTNTERDTEHTGHSNGGNPHDALYFLEHGECPANGCESEFDTFRKLRGHIGGSVAGETGTGPHSRVNLRLNDLDITVETEQ